MAEVKYEIKQNIGIISSNDKSGWNKELNLVSWNEGDPKYDIRDWNKDHTKMSRGITLTEDELASLVAIAAEAL